MARPPVTVAAVAGADRDVTRAFLALLADTLAPGDQVVVCGDPAHDPAAAGSWRVKGRRKLGRPPVPPAVHDVVVVLDERSVPVGPWLAPLVGALDDPATHAAAARTNIAAGDELLVGVPYRPQETALHRKLVRTRAATRHREVTAVRCLAGPSLALRRATLEAAGGVGSLRGPDPIAALARRVAGAGGRMVVAEGSYLHHGGGPAPWGATDLTGPLPLLSACLITKDEHDNLPRCLASIEGLVDEVVVYDTGSTDDTVAIARAAGATVAEGHWDGDFSRARNEALARCRGQWILWVDADEAVRCDDPQGTRRMLAALSSDVESIAVMIDHLRGNRASTAFTLPSTRLFRRAHGHWIGKIHEQVAARAGSPDLSRVSVAGIRITHWGFLVATVVGRDKGRRNLRSALHDLTADGELEWGARLLSLGRSYILVGRTEEGLELTRSALAASTNPSVRRLAQRSIVRSLLALGRPEEALGEVRHLRDMLDVPLLADTLEGEALLAARRYEEALAALARVGDGVDDAGEAFTSHGVAADKAVALAALGRHSEAADVLLDALRGVGGMDVHVGTLVDQLDRAGRPLTELVRAVPSDGAVAFLGQLGTLDPSVADRLLEAWHAEAPSAAVLATAAYVATGFPVERLVTWSERLRTAGLGRACPLVATVADEGRAAAERLVGAALAVEPFGDARGRQAFGGLCLQLAEVDRPGVRRRLAANSPSVLDAFDALSDLPPTEIAAFPEPLPEDPEHGALAGRAVLVVDERTASLRALAVACALRRHGHQVTLAHPQPVAGTTALLAPLGIEVRGWQRPGGRDGRDRRPAAAAALYAERPYDVVVTSTDDAQVLTELRRVLPGAHLVLDVDYGSVPEGLAGQVDLVLAADPAVPAEHAVATLCPVSAPSVFTAPAGAPEPLRYGACVVGDFRTASGDELARLGRIAGALAGRLGDLPVAVVGDDPDGRVAALLPGTLALGPLADPLPWLRTTRLVLVATGAGAAHWLAAAALCGTPALVVPADDGSLDQVAPAVAALADPAQPDLWQRFAPQVVDHSDPLGTDPLDRLPAPWRRGRGVPPARGVTVVRRGYPPDLSPTEERLVVELTWPYGGIPLEWLGALRDVADAVGVPSSWARDHAMASGTVPSVQVLPTAVDAELFSPHGEYRPLPTGKGTKLLFVGQATDRDGIDALLECYLTSFGSGDDVCLVVHLVGDGDPEWLDVRQVARAGGERPEILLVDGPLGAGDRAALLRACDVLVDCRRAVAEMEPVLEAMATGLPVVTLDQGPSRDLCDHRTGWLVQCREVAVDTADLGVTPSPHGIWQLEPDRHSLAVALRQAVGAPHDRLLKGLAARDRATTRSATSPTVVAPGTLGRPSDQDPALTRR